MSFHQVGLYQRIPCSGPPLSRISPESELFTVLLPGGDTIRWLQSLQAGFRQAASGRSSASRAALPHVAALSLDDAQPSLCEPLVLALPALLSHPEPAVQIEAACTLCQAVKAVPLLGISFLPLIVYHVQRSVARDKTKLTRAGAHYDPSSVSHTTEL